MLTGGLWAGSRRDEQCKVVKHAGWLGFPELMTVLRFVKAGR